MRAFCFVALAWIAGCLGPRTVTHAQSPQPTFDAQTGFEPLGGLVIVPVRLGDAPYRFVLDTGAGATVVTERAFKAQRLRRRGGIPVEGSSGRTRWRPVTRLPALHFGGATFYNVGAVVLDLEILDDYLCLPIDGIVGTNVLTHGVLEIDYAGHSVRLATGLDPRAGGTTMALAGQWMPLLALGNHAVLVDTGSNGSLDVPRALAEGLGVRDFFRGTGTQTHGIHGEHQAASQAFAWPAAKVGALDLEGVDAVATKNGATILGNEVLKAYTLRIDYAKRSATVWPNGTPLPRGHRTYGLSWDYDERGAEVVFVWAGSAAASAGVAVGDRISAFDGKPISALTSTQRCEIRRDWRTRQSDAVLTIAGREVPLTKAPLYPR